MLNPGMELRHLRYFTAVAQEENVTRAALQLHVSQPALSRQIRDLEDELGFALLERSAKSVRLTEAGRVFLKEAQAILERVEQGVQEARAVATGAKTKLHVGYAPSLTARLLPPSLRAFQSQAPAVRVILHDLSTEEMLAGLQGGRLQIAFLVRPSGGMLRGLRFEDLLRDPLRLAVAPKHAWARRRSVRLEDVQALVAYSRREYPEYHELLAKLFRKTRKNTRIVEEHDSVSSLIAAIEADVGLAIVPESIACFAGPRLKLIPIEPAPEPLIVGAAWLKTGLTPDAERFLESARKTADEQARITKVLPPRMDANGRE